MTEQTNYFKKLNDVDVSAKTVMKNDKFSYLSWAFAQEVLGQHHPDAIIEVREYGENNLPYLETPLGFFVQVFVTINEVKRGRPFVVSDSTNRPLGQPYWDKKEQKYIDNRRPTAFDINTAIQRAFVKSVAEHGLGLYIYAGEDLPTSTVENRRDEILTAFAEWRQNPKTENYFTTKEALLEKKMEEWEMSVLEHYFKELSDAAAEKARREKARKAAEDAKLVEEEKKRREKPATGAAEEEPKKNLKDKGLDLEKVKFIDETCEQYPHIGETVTEFMTKVKKEIYTQLTAKQFENLYGIVEIKLQTALKEEEERALNV
jgi:hypothetical protein